MDRIHCKDCAYWDGRYVDNFSRGECRFDPPQGGAPEATLNGYKTEPRCWPIVRATDWCGRAQHKE